MEVIFHKSFVYTYVFRSLNSCAEVFVNEIQCCQKPRICLQQNILSSSRRISIPGQIVKEKIESEAIMEITYEMELAEDDHCLC